MVPAVVPILTKAGLEVVVEAGPGPSAGFPDSEYIARGAKILPAREEVFRTAEIILQVLVSRLERRDRQGRPAALAPRAGPGRVSAAAGVDRDDPRNRGSRRHLVFRRADAANDSGSEHGRPVVDGDDFRLQGGRRGRRSAAAALSDDDDGGRHDHAGAGADHRRRRGRIAGHRHGAAAGRGRLGLRHAGRVERAGAKPWAADSSSCRSRRKTRRTLAATASAQDDTFLPPPARAAGPGRLRRATS